MDPGATPGRITPELSISTDALFSGVPVFSASRIQLVGAAVKHFRYQSGKRKTGKEVDPLTSTSNMPPLLARRVD